MRTAGQAGVVLGVYHVYDTPDTTLRRWKPHVYETFVTTATGTVIPPCYQCFWGRILNSETKGRAVL